MNCLSFVLLAALCSIAYSTQTACYSNGKYYTVGESFMKECNSCTCGEDGQAGCTKMACTETKRGRRTSVPYIEGKCYYDGQFYDDGASFKDSDDCNTCGCTVYEDGSSGVYCTLMACFPLNEINQ